MTLAIATSATRPARRFVAAAAIAAALGAGASAVWISAGASGAVDIKHAARLDAGPVAKRELAFYPREQAADDSIRNFKPGKAWAIEAPAAEPAPGLLAQAAPLATPAAAKPKFAVAPLPPVRPLVFAKAAPADLAPHYADLPQPRRTASAGEGFGVSRFVPTGSDVMKKIGGLGETMRESIGSVGSSLGRLMRISSR